ncbi:hypothetical protein M0C34_01085 [Agarivorans sp. TSD2052]|uniref:hypothetical protein n=1 Tax=Agarivorans sp. TSD2052 TaxID=2937286 RepID=UPI00200BE382|nr:hypothetical protein [Agarivorans sp. TSD2052]UPW18901.1 hypothetical protein M0C34_01085 [Agarivorans sp. TSD2052]
MNNLENIDWFKLKAQFGNPLLLQHWLGDYLNGAEQELSLLKQAQQQQRCSAGLLMQLQGLASLLCSPSLTHCVKQLKHSQAPADDLQACITSYQGITAEVTEYLRAHSVD